MLPTMFFKQEILEEICLERESYGRRKRIVSLSLSLSLLEIIRSWRRYLLREVVLSLGATFHSLYLAQPTRRLCTLNAMREVAGKF